MDLTDEMEVRIIDFLARTYDAQKRYEKASEHAKNRYLKDFFAQMAVERQGFRNELRVTFLVHRPQVEEIGSTLGKLHRSWLDVKAFFASNNDRAMLQEAIHGERMALAEYRALLALKNDLPPGTEALLLRQMKTISTNLLTIERMEAVA